MEIIKRKQAISLGLSKYYTGKPCKNNHLSEKYVKGSNCISCAKDRHSQFRKTDRHNAYQAEYRNSEVMLQYRSSDKYRRSLKLSSKKTNEKYVNANKSRKYYDKRKYKIIVKDKCELCESQYMVQAHHDDYNLPLEVTFLCRTCHSEWHRNNTPLNREKGIFT